MENNNYNNECNSCNIILLLNEATNNKHQTLNDLIKDTLTNKGSIPEDNFSFYKMLNNYIELENDLYKRNQYNNTTRNLVFELFRTTLTKIHENCDHINFYK